MSESVPFPEVVRPYALPPLPQDCFYVEPEDPAAAGDGGVCITEASDPYDTYLYRARRIVHQSRTTFQHVVIADTYNYGLALFIDGAIQSSSEDEALYHEMLVQPAMLLHPLPRDVLIIGGGEGATLREVLVHGTVRSATMVDLDGELVELCREHLPQWHRGAFDDPRVRLVIDDGRKFVAEDDGFYDVVVIDVVDMLDNGPAQALYTVEFYQLLRQRLRPEGIVVVQGLEFSFLDDKAHAAVVRTLRTMFAEVHSYQAFIPSFLSAWGFVIASDWFAATDLQPEPFDRTIESRLGTQWLDHLTGDYLKSAFTHDKWTRFLLSQPGPILQDGVPFIPPPDIEELDETMLRFPVDPTARL